MLRRCTTNVKDSSKRSNMNGRIVRSYSTYPEIEDRVNKAVNEGIFKNKSLFFRAAVKSFLDEIDDNKRRAENKKKCLTQTSA